MTSARSSTTARSGWKRHPDLRASPCHGIGFDAPATTSGHAALRALVPMSVRWFPTHVVVCQMELQFELVA
jgi:hypothetical protein